MLQLPRNNMPLPSFQNYQQNWTGCELLLELFDIRNNPIGCAQQNDSSLSKRLHLTNDDKTKIY